MVVHLSVAFLHRACSLERFLCCMDLEPGAIALGWFSFVKNFCTIILALVVILIRTFTPCSDIVVWLSHIGYGVSLEECIHITEEGYVNLTATIIIIIYIGLTYISYRFVAATKTRKHKEVVPFMTYLAIMTITSFLAIIKWTTFAIIFGVITGLFYGYFLLCVGAMYERFLHEHHQKQRAVSHFVDKETPGNIRCGISIDGFEENSSRSVNRSC